MDKWQALNSFFNSFGVMAFEVGTVPDEYKDTYPRITYESRIGSVGETVQIDASIWDLSSSWGNVDRIANAIEQRILSMECPQITGGRYYVYKGTPYAQRMNDPENDNIRRTVLHINFEFLTL